MIKKKKYFLLISCLIATTLMLVNSCKKKDDEPDPLPPNPYDLIDYGTITIDPPPDPNSLLGIHVNILQPSCALPGCHDGNFEPDFRTPQSSFSTMVYHPIVKNNAAEEFKYRVVPNDTAQSVLHERITNCCFVNLNDRMPQDNIGTPLPNADINAISNWIMSGAPDISGNIPTYPNLEPIIEPFYVALDQATYTIQYQEEENRIDSIFYNPFYLPDSTDIAMIFLVDDDSTSINQLQVNQMKLSTDPDNYSGAQIFTATYLYLPPPDDVEVYLVQFNTADVPDNQIVYFRYFVNDGDHTNNTQFPTDNLPIEYKTFWSFYVY